MKFLFPLALLVSFHSTSFARANPSSVFCEQQGGKQNPGMETCFFGPDSGIGAWTLYRQMNTKSQQIAVKAFFRKIDRPNPNRQTLAPIGPSAQNYCEAYGGQFRLERPIGDEGGIEPICKFKDGSEIDAVTLKNGHEHPNNAALTKVLNAGASPKKVGSPKDSKDHTGIDTSA